MLKSRESILIQYTLFIFFSRAARARTFQRFCNSYLINLQRIRANKKQQQQQQQQNNKNSVAIVSTFLCALLAKTLSGGLTSLTHFEYGTDGMHARIGIHQVTLNFSVCTRQSPRKCENERLDSSACMALLSTLLMIVISFLFFVQTNL